MKRLGTIGIVFLLGAVLAAGYPEFVAAYLQQNPERARLEAQLEAARTRYLALKDDPYAAPFERAEAEDAWVRARLALRKTELGLQAEAFALYAAVPLARLGVRVAEARLEAAKIADRAAAIRFAQGAIGPNQRAQAAERLTEAEAGLEKARARLEDALAALARYGDFQAERVPALAPPENLSAAAHPDLRLAGLELRSARRAYQAALGPDTPRVERTRRKAELQAAERALAEKEAALKRALAEKEAAWRAARREVALKRAALENRRRALLAARLRLEKGTASPLEVKNAGLEAASAELALAQARKALGQAVLDLLPFAKEAAR